MEQFRFPMLLALLLVLKKQDTVAKGFCPDSSTAKAADACDPKGNAKDFHDFC